MKPKFISKLLFLLLIIILLVTLIACDSTKALNIQGDGTSVEKDLQQEVASTERDYQKPDSLTETKENNI